MIIVRALTICPKGFFGGLKNVVRGRIGAYTGMCEQECQQVFGILVQHTQEMGANVIVGLRCDVPAGCDAQSPPQKCSAALPP